MAMSGRTVRSNETTSTLLPGGLVPGGGSAPVRPDGGSLSSSVKPVVVGVICDGVIVKPLGNPLPAPSLTHGTPMPCTAAPPAAHGGNTSSILTSNAPLTPLPTFSTTTT